MEKKDKPKKGPTQSQKLRIALMSLHKRGGYIEDFEKFYEDRMNKIIKFVNEKPK